jgi:outer membrane protein assembly factor BamB
LTIDPELSGPVWYKASDSDVITLVVQEQQVGYYPGFPLPTEYWTRPIGAELREWYTIAGNWLNVPTNNYVVYNDDAPESAHILWTKPLSTGGLVGGELVDKGYEDGDAYEGKYLSSVIINGVLYYNRFAEAARGGLPGQGVYAVDLHTGKELWFRNNTRLAFGQTFYWESFNYYGTFAYLWETVGSTWNAYDPMTGEWVYTMKNVPSGYTVYGPRGEIYIYSIDLQKGRMTLWNSSATVNPQLRNDSWDGSWARNMGRDGFNRVYPASRGMMWNKTIPTGLAGDIVMVLDDRVIGTTASGGWTHIGNDPVTTWALSLKPGQEGALIFKTNFTRPAADITLIFGSASLEDNVYVLSAKETRQWYGFSLDTGSLIWGPTPTEETLGIYGMSAYMAYGKLIGVNTMGGTVYCYDAKTGAPLWKYQAKDQYNEILWSDKWPLQMLFIVDGKIYLDHTEHSGNNPKARGAPLICLNVTTGEEIWKMTGGYRGTDWGGPPIIGDSLIAGFNTYDGRIYTIGKGPSATMVSAPEAGIPQGSSVTIRGTVSDVSPGTEDYALTARFPNGVPAVSDEAQSEWMQYVYMQYPRPANATGVAVRIDVIDSNINLRTIGTTTSDSQGMFTLSWKPDITGTYKVIATFEGTKSYWPSSAETSFVVDDAISAGTIQPNQTPQTSADQYLLLGIVAVIATVVVVGALILLQLRKK